MRLRLPLLTSSLILTLLLTGFAQAQTIKVGVVTEFTGFYAPLAAASIEAMKTAVEEINAKGGVLSKRLELVMEDSGGNPDAAVRLYSDLVIKEKVQFFVGPLSPVVATQLANIAEQFKTPMILFSPYRVAALGDRRYVFQLAPDAYMEGAAAAFVAAGQREWKRFAIIGPDTASNRIAAESFKSRSPRSEIVKEVWLNPADRDYRPHLQAIKDAHADAVYSTFFGQAGMAFLQQAKSTMSDNVGLIQRVDLDDLQPTAVGLREETSALAVAPFSALTSPEATTFQKSLVKRTGRNPSEAAVLAYDAVSVLVQALRTAQSLDPERVKATLERNSFNTLRGRLRFRSEDHLANAPLYVGRLSRLEGNLSYSVSNVMAISGERLLPPPQTAGILGVSGRPGGDPQGVPPAATPRYSNAWFSNDYFANLQPSLLVAHKEYRLQFNIGERREGISPISPIPLSPGLTKGDKELEVTVSSPLFEPFAQRQKLYLPPQNDSKTLEFVIKPVREGPGRVDILIAHNNETFDVLSFNVHVLDANKPLDLQALPPQPAPSKQLPPGNIDAARGADYSITIIATDPNRPITVCVSLSALTCGQSQATPAQIEQVLKSLRKTLYQLVHQKRVLNKDAALPDLAVHGSDLYKMLFVDGVAQDVQTAMAHLRQTPAANLTPLTIQIVEIGQRTYIPWQLLYDDKSFNTWEKDKYNKNSFWGYKYIIDYRPSGPGSMADLSPSIDNCHSFNLVFGSYKGDPALQIPLQEQRDFFDKNIRGSWKEFNERTPFLQYFVGPQRGTVSMLYFYTHATNGRDVNDSNAYIPIPDEAAIYFSATETLKPKDLRDLRLHLGDTVALPLEGVPIIFINACEATAVHTYDYDKFVDEFAKLGTRGLLGAEAEIDIIVGGRFGLKFFERLFSSESIGRALYELRREFLDTHGNPIGFLYSHYGNSHVSLKCQVHAAMP